MNLQSILLAAIVVVGGTGAARAATYAFDFSDLSFAGAPGSAVSSTGIGVTFAASNAAGFSAVYDTSGTFQSLGNWTLQDNNIAGGDTLTLTFASAVNELKFNFALIDYNGAQLNGADTLTVTTSSSQSYTATVPTNYTFPEGAVDLVDGSGFTSVTISSPYAFAVGLTDVPEPASLGMLGAGLLGLAGVRRRRG